MYIALLAVISIAEFVLFFMMFSFFSRLKKSEDILTSLRDNQSSLLEKMRANAELEQELVQSFVKRQNELISLNQKLEERAAELRSLLEQAESISRSPQFLRELILTGDKKGRSPAQLARSTGLSIDEVELILAQSK